MAPRKLLIQSIVGVAALLLILCLYGRPTLQNIQSVVKVTDPKGGWNSSPLIRGNGGNVTRDQSPDDPTFSENDISIDPEPDSASSAVPLPHAEGTLKYLESMSSKYDKLRLLNNQSFQAGLIHQGSLLQIGKVIELAESEGRPLKVGMLGGSVTAGRSVSHKQDAYAVVLGTLIKGLSLTPEVRIVNVAQGASGFSLPFYCLDEVYKVVHEQGEVARPPDVWVVEYLVNYDASYDAFLAFLGKLQMDPKLSHDQTAILLLALPKQLCLPDPWSGKLSSGCNYQPYFSHYRGAATFYNLPLLSVLHSIAVNAKVPPRALYKDKNLFQTLSKDQVKFIASSRYYLYAEDGYNIHFNEYGHHLTASLIAYVFAQGKELYARDKASGKQPLTESPKVSLKELPPKALKKLLSVLPDNQTSTKTWCYTTLSQGRPSLLMPQENKGYDLEVFKSHAVGTDLKIHWIPKAADASIVFPLPPLLATSSQICLHVIAAPGESVKASVIRAAGPVKDTLHSCSFTSIMPDMRRYQILCSCPLVSTKLPRINNLSLQIEATSGLMQLTSLIIY